LAEVDICQLVLASRMVHERRELGDVVIGLLRTPEWSPAERAALERTGTRLDDRPIVLLTWLVHVTDLLAKSDRYRDGSVWAQRNVQPVLEWLRTNHVEASRSP
jgi:hypothetical protein